MTQNHNEPRVVSIEYCKGCRWMLKAFWLAQELLTTFEQDLDAVTVIPSDSKGIFEIKINNTTLWDRKEQGGFPAVKELKQIVRDRMDPSMYLGHSDTLERRTEVEGTTSSIKRDDTYGIFQFSDPTTTQISPTVLDVCSTPHPTVTIYYCTGCRWLLRAAYFGQELLTTFSEEVKSVSLASSKPPEKGGRFVSE
jgi:selenoprotein W-related protein